MTGTFERVRRRQGNASCFGCTAADLEPPVASCRNYEGARRSARKPGPRPRKVKQSSRSVRTGSERGCPGGGRLLWCVRCLLPSCCLRWQSPVGKYVARGCSAGLPRRRRGGRQPNDWNLCPNGKALFQKFLKIRSTIKMFLCGRLRLVPTFLVICSTVQMFVRDGVNRLMRLANVPLSLFAQKCDQVRALSVTCKEIEAPAKPGAVRVP